MPRRAGLYAARQRSSEARTLRHTRSRRGGKRNPRSLVTHRISVFLFLLIPFLSPKDNVMTQITKTAPLGRGLSALFGDADTSYQAKSGAPATPTDKVPRSL